MTAAAAATSTSRPRPRATSRTTCAQLLKQQADGFRKLIDKLQSRLIFVVFLCLVIVGGLVGIELTGFQIPGLP